MKVSGFLIGAVTVLVLTVTAFWFAQYLWRALRRRSVRDDEPSLWI